LKKKNGIKPKMLDPELMNPLRNTAEMSNFAASNGMTDRHDVHGFSFLSSLEFPFFTTLKCRRAKITHKNRKEFRNFMF
jgi:hypothetical protein